jgi:hypothetical protein
MKFQYLTISLILFLTFSGTLSSQTFSVGKYGGDFLSVGGGARALALGSAYASIADDASAVYWNPAGLARLTQLELMYMHSERFNGVVGYDFASAGFPIKDTDGVFGVGFMRQAVDGIQNTLDAWNEANGQPLPNPTAQFSQFSAFDLAFLISYAQPFSEDNNNSWGVSFKVLHSKIGPFAQTWGYSLDVGIQERDKYYAWGIAVQDITTMFKFWQTNKQALKGLENFNDIVPNGQNEQILPTVKLSAAFILPIKNTFEIITVADADIRFENLQTYYLNVGRTSFEPHVGMEFSFKNLVSVRGGLTDFYFDDKGKMTFSPTVGLGLGFSRLNLDYGMSSFSGINSDLGNTHRISLRIKLNPI